MDRATLDHLAALATASAFERDGTELLDCLSVALSIETDDATCGRLLLARAIARQGHLDPLVPARDAAEAVLLLRRAGEAGPGALAAACASGMVQRTGDLARAIDLAVDAMVLSAQADLDDPHAVRAANALAVLFAQLTAFELAHEMSVRAFRSIGSVTPNGRDALAYTLAYITVEARHAGIDLDDAPGRAAARRLVTDGVAPLGPLLGRAMETEFALLDGMPIDRAGLDLDAEQHGPTTAPRLLAWHRLVRADAAMTEGRPDIARRLLDEALPVLVDVADDHRTMRGLDLRSRAGALLGDVDGAIADAREAARLARHWQVDQVGRLATQIARRAELEQARAALHLRLESLRREMAIDLVTGLGTRRWLETSLDELAALDDHGAVVVFDLDHFKAVNDSVGHPTGDVVLGTIGRLLRDHARGSDLVARYGGEEFVAVLPGAEEKAAIGLAERIRVAVTEHPWDTIAPGLAITLSAGVAAGPLTAIRSTLQRADDALYEAKRAGRNRVLST